MPVREEQKLKKDRKFINLLHAIHFYEHYLCGGHLTTCLTGKWFESGYQPEPLLVSDDIIAIFFVCF